VQTFVDVEEEARVRHDGGDEDLEGTGAAALSCGLLAPSTPLHFWLVTSPSAPLFPLVTALLEAQRRGMREEEKETDLFKRICPEA
jgi:hypothetical protein